LKIIEALMHKINMFHRTGVLTTVGFENSGADWLEQYKIHRRTECDCSPHKVYGPESNDLALQLRKHGFDSVILAGMS
jgi:nicotinamidase-related amidase